MCERAVSFSHTMHIFFALERTTLFVISIHNFRRKFLCHGFTTALTSEIYHIFHRNRLLAIRTDFSRNLECCTTDSTRLNLYLRSDFIKSRLPDFKSRFLRIFILFTYDFKSSIEYLIRSILLAVIHKMIYKLGHFLVSKNGIRKDHTFLWFSFSHFVLAIIDLGLLIFYCLQRPRRDRLLNLYYLLPRKPNDFTFYLDALGLLAPYFERRWVRFATPAVSRVPRTI